MTSLIKIILLAMVLIVMADKNDRIDVFMANTHEYDRVNKQLAEAIAQQTQVIAVQEQGIADQAQVIADQAQIIDEYTGTTTALQNAVTVLNETNQEQRAKMGVLNTTVQEHKTTITSLKETIARLNETNQEQAMAIQELQIAVQDSNMTEGKNNVVRQGTKKDEVSAGNLGHSTCFEKFPQIHSPKLFPFFSLFSSATAFSAVLTSYTTIQRDGPPVVFDQVLTNNGNG